MTAMNWCAIGTHSFTSPIIPLTRNAHFADTDRQFPYPAHNENQSLLLKIGTKKVICITMRDRSRNRKPLQRGRNLSVEAIQTVQAMKRAQYRNEETLLGRVFASKFKRLLKVDMMAVLHELLRQNEGLLALKVFEDIQKEYWYKPQLSLYAEIISVLEINGLREKVDQLFTEMKTRTCLEHDTAGFNVLLENLMSFNKIGLAIECYNLMKTSGCEPDKLSFRILIRGLESREEMWLSAIVRREAVKYYGKSLEFLEDKEELVVN